MASNSIILWYGGKGHHYKKIIPLIPKTNIYCEPFSGGLSIMLNKEKGNVEVINDLNHGLINFYRVMQNKDLAKQMKYKLLWTPYSRKLYNQFKAEWFLQEDNLERAYQWYVVLLLSFGGKWGTGLRIQKKNTKNNVSIKLRRMIKRIEFFQERLRDCFIECDDFRKIMKRYDTEDTFFYLDPPYVHETRSKNFYENEMSNFDHEELVELCLNSKGKILLSGYNNFIYEKLEEQGWKKIEFETICRISAFKEGEQKLKPRRTEVLWYNYELPKTLKKEELF